MTKATNVVAKAAAVVAGLGLVASSFAFAPVARAQSTADLQAQIQALLAQVAALQGQMGGSTGGTAFTMDLTIGSSGAEVTALQNFLISKGFSIPAGATGYFGTQTQSALAAYQAANGISPAAGYFGPVTRAKVNAAGGTSGGSTGGNAGGALEGDTGEIEDADFVSSLSSEEVGEDEEDVEIAGLEIEAGSDSDIELTAVALNFDYADTGGSDDLDDYITEVSVWLDGDEVGRVEVDDMDDDDWTDTISLDDAIVRAGETGDLTVAVSAASNLDSTDAGEQWNVSFQSVRFMDGDGAVVTEDTVGDIGETDDDTTTDSDERDFSVVTFASAADIDLQVSEGDDAINDARSIAVDEDDDTDGVEILSFEVEVDGDSDLTIDDISVDFTAVGAGVGEIINSVELVVDGDAIATETVSSTTVTSRTIDFDNVDWTLGAGESAEVTVVVDVNDLHDATFTAGDTLAADVNPDDAGWSVEDEEGEDVAASDKSGSASSETHSFFADGLNIANGEADAPDTEDTNGDTAGGKRGLYTISFEVTAFGDTIYIPTGATSATSSVQQSGVAYAIEKSDGTQIALNGVGLASTTAAVSSTADTSGGYFVIDEGETETFELSLTLTPTADGFFRAQVHGVNFNVGSASTADTLQTANPQTDFESSFISIDV